MTPVEVLRAARELLSDPKRWTKGADARDRNGAITHCGSRRAVCWCVTGATGHVDVEGLGIQADRFLIRALRLRKTALENWNDNPRRTHGDVLTAFDRAIALAEKSGAP